MKTCIRVKYRAHKLFALLDTGSDITIAGRNVANRCGWELKDETAAPIKVATEEQLVIDGVATVPLRVGGRSTVTDVLVTGDITGLILGVDWMAEQGPLTWDFQNERVRLGNGEWIKLQKELSTCRVRRVFVSEKRADISELNEPGQCCAGTVDDVSRDVPVLVGESFSLPAGLQLQKEHGFSAIEMSTEEMYGAQFHPEEWVLSVESEQKMKQGGADGSHEDPGVLALSGQCDPSSGTQQLLAPPELLSNIEVRVNEAEVAGEAWSSTHFSSVKSESTRIDESVEVHSEWCSSGTPMSRAGSGCVVGQRLGASGSETVLAGRVSCFGPRSASPTGNLTCSNSSENATGRVGSVTRLEVGAEVHSEFDTLEKFVDSCQPKGRAESEVVEIHGERLDSDGSTAAGEQMRMSCFISQSDRLVGEHLSNLGSNGSKAALAGRMGMSCFAPQVAHPDNFRSNGFYQSGRDSVGRSSIENTGSVEMSRVNEVSNAQVSYVAEQRGIWGIEYGPGVRRLNATQFLYGRVKYVYSSMSIVRRRGVSHCGDDIAAELGLDE